jgi:hypothetical protein
VGQIIVKTHNQAKEEMQVQCSKSRQVFAIISEEKWGKYVEVMMINLKIYFLP